MLITDIFSTFDAPLDVQPYPYQWGQWKRKFAWRKTYVNNKDIWLKFYYRRDGIRTSVYGYHDAVHQTAVDMFDILKKS